MMQIRLILVTSLITLLIQPVQAQDVETVTHAVQPLAIGRSTRLLLERLASETGSACRVDPKIRRGTTCVDLSKISPRDALTVLMSALGLTMKEERTGLWMRPDERKMMRIGMVSGIGKQSSITISCPGPFVMEEDATQDIWISPDKKQVRLIAKGDAWEVSVEGEQTRTVLGPIRLFAGNGGVFEVVQPKVKTTRYRGALYLSTSAKSGFIAINELPVEDYVRGVIPMEVPRSFHPEAQKALTIAIRTYALKNINSSRHSGYDLCDNTHCQGFAGASRDAEWIDKVVNETSGQIAMYDGKPISATYSTDCGGMTQSNEGAGFGKDPVPYLRPVADNPGGRSAVSLVTVVPRETCDPAEPVELAKEAMPLPRVADQPTIEPPKELPRVVTEPLGPKYRFQDSQSDDHCAACPYHTWSIVLKASDIEKVFKTGKLQSLEFARYDESGRVTEVVITGDAAQKRVPGHQFRMAFGENVIKSTRMVLSKTSGGDYLVEGKGYGHGVGLCAFGANGLAKSGKTHTEILKHYYTGIEIGRRE